MAIAYVAAPMYLIMGLSVMLYAKQWQKIMNNWSKDHLQIFPLMFLYPILGMIVIGMHNVWEWNVWLIVTIIGWALLLKGAMYFLLPGSTLKKMMKLKDCPTLLYLAGILAIAVGLVLGYHAIYLPMMG